jgi:hypothetical protein
MNLVSCEIIVYDLEASNKSDAMGIRNLDDLQVDIYMNL